MSVSIVTFILALSTANAFPDNRLITGITAFADDSTTHALDQCVLFGVYNRDTLIHSQAVLWNHDLVGVVPLLVLDWLVHWQTDTPAGLS